MSIRKEAIMSQRAIPEQNNRETGARKYPVSKQQQQAGIDTHAGMPTANPFGLTQPADETSEKTRQSEGVDQPMPAAATEKFAGAGPAIAEHSKDAKAP